MSEKAKKRKISMEPILQDFTVTSFSDLNPDILGPSDSSISEEIENYDVLINTTLNQTDLKMAASPYPSDSSLKNDSIFKVPSDSKTESAQRPFQKRSRKKPMRYSLFDSILQDSITDSSYENVKKPFQRKRKFNYNLRSSMFDSDISASESDITLKESPFKKPFQRKLKIQPTLNLFDSLTNNSQPNTPDQLPKPFTRKSKKTTTNVFDEDLSNDSINLSSPVANFITRRKIRRRKNDQSSFFNEDLNSSQINAYCSLKTRGSKHETETNHIQNNSGMWDDALDFTANESQDQNSLMSNPRNSNDNLKGDVTKSFNLEYEESDGNSKDSLEDEETKEPGTGDKEKKTSEVRESIDSLYDKLNTPEDNKTKHLEENDAETDDRTKDLPEDEETKKTETECKVTKMLEVTKEKSAIFADLPIEQDTSQGEKTTHSEENCKGRKSATEFSNKQDILEYEISIELDEHMVKEKCINNFFDLQSCTDKSNEEHGDKTLIDGGSPKDTEVYDHKTDGDFDNQGDETLINDDSPKDTEVCDHETGGDFHKSNEEQGGDETLIGGGSPKDTEVNDCKTDGDCKSLNQLPDCKSPFKRSINKENHNEYLDQVNKENYGYLGTDNPENKYIEDEDGSQSNIGVPSLLTEIYVAERECISLERKSSLLRCREEYSLTSVSNDLSNSLLHTDFEVPKNTSETENPSCSSEVSFKDRFSSRHSVKGKRVSFSLEETVPKTSSGDSHNIQDQSQIQMSSKSKTSSCASDFKMKHKSEKLNGSKINQNEACIGDSVSNNWNSGGNSTKRKSSLRKHNTRSDLNIISNSRENSICLKNRRVSFKIDVERSDSINQSNFENSDKLKKLNEYCSNISLESLVYDNPSEGETPNSESVYIDIHPSRGISISTNGTDSFFKNVSIPSQRNEKNSNRRAENAQMCENEESKLDQENSSNNMGERGHESCMGGSYNKDGNLAENTKNEEFSYIEKGRETSSKEVNKIQPNGVFPENEYREEEGKLEEKKENSFIKYMEQQEQSESEEELEPEGLEDQDTEEEDQETGEEEQETEEEDQGTEEEDQEPYVDEEIKAQLSEEDDAQVSEEDSAQVSEEDDAQVSEEDSAQVSEEDDAQVSEEDDAQVSEEDDAQVSEEDDAQVSEEDDVQVSEEEETQISEGDEGQVSEEEEAEVSEQGEEFERELRKSSVVKDYANGKPGCKSFDVNKHVAYPEQEENLYPGHQIHEGFKVPSITTQQKKKIRRSSLFKEQILEVPTKSQLKDILNRIPFSELKKKKTLNPSEHCISREQMQQYEIEEEVRKNQHKKSQNNARFTKPTSCSLKRLRKWVYPKFYDFLTSKLKPQYGIRSRVRAEELVLFIVEHIERIMKKKELEREDVEGMKMELARLGIIRTHWDFYKFISEHFDYAFKEKMYPSVPGTGPRAFDFGPRNVLENIL